MYQEAPVVEEKKSSHVKQVAIAAVAAVTISAVSIAGALHFASPSAATEAEVDLSTETADGSVVNAAEVLDEAEAALAEWAEANDIALAESPARSLAFFIRSDEDGFIEDTLAVGPILYPVSSAGTFVSLDIEFTNGNDGVTASIADDAEFKPQDFTGMGTMFRVDGIQPSPVSVMTATGFDSNDLPIRLWNTSTVTPLASEVEIGKTEALPGFDAPVTTGEVRLADGELHTSTVNTAKIVHSVIDPLTGEEYTNVEEDSVWVLLEMEPGFYTADHRELGLWYQVGTWVSTSLYGNNTRVTEDRMILKVPADEAGNVQQLDLHLYTDSQEWREGATENSICVNPEFLGYGVDDDEVESSVSINPTEAGAKMRAAEEDAIAAGA